ncbi:hypothetical protein JCM6882_003703 [Rhodosporidiobolus microsporus]
MSGSDSDGDPDPASYPGHGGAGAGAGGLSTGLHRSWGGLAGLSSAAGGGRVDGAFLTEPGSYEDFTYPSPFDYSSFAARSPSNSAGAGPSLSRPFSPFSSAHLRVSSNPYSPLPSFSPYPSYGGSSPSNTAAATAGGSVTSHALPAAPPTPPAPLFDEGETALFSSFLNIIDVDPNFLFNPVLPPGMPSPPSAEMIRQMEAETSGRALAPAEEEERSQREQLGRGVGGLSLSAAARFEPPAPAHAPIPRAPVREPSPAFEELEQRFREDEDEDAPHEDEDGEETAKPDDDDSDFDPTPSRGGGGGTRRKSRGGAANGAANGRSGKKARVQQPPAPSLEEGVEEDVKMALGDEDDAVTPSTTASGRPRRATRVPRRLSSSASSAAVAAAASSAPSSASSARPSLRRPSLSKPAFAPPAPAPPISLHAGPPPPLSTRTRATSSTPSASSSDSPPAPSAASTAAAGNKPAPLTESEKRSNHIASEQRRRNAIKSGFQDLVDLLVAGSAASGIVLGEGEEDGAAGGGKKGAGGPGKGKGRGRGRKGEVQTNASKSVVLEKAAGYILWLERGNRALEAECARVEGALRAEGVRVE